MKARRSRGVMVPAVLTLAALAVLVSLGNWQVRRLAWKEGLIASVAERPPQPPLDLNAAGGLDAIGDPASFLEQYEYRAATLAGAYRPAGEVRVFTSLDAPRGHFGGPGYWVLTPFLAKGSSLRVYVNRGFVPQDKVSDYAPPPAGEVTLTGLIRAPDRGSWLTPKPDLDNSVFYARNVKDIAAATGLGRQAGFLIDLPAAETPGELPQGGETRMVFANNHLQYAFTWYGLAAALLAVFAVFAWRRLKEPQAGSLTPPRRHP